MKYTRKNPTETKVTLSATLDASDLANIKKTTVGRLSKKVTVPGFRQGKVPASVAEKHLDSNTLNMEIAEDAVNAFVIEILTKEDVRPLDQPKVELAKYVPGETLEFTANVEILPTITLGDYKKLKAAKDPIKVTGKDIEEVLERMRQGMAKKEDVDRPAKEGDEVIIDFKGTDEAGKEVAGATGHDYPLTLGSDSFIPGFEKGLVGKKAGEHIDLPLAFPKIITTSHWLAQK